MSHKVVYLMFDILNKPQIYILLVFLCTSILAVSYRYTFLDSLDTLFSVIGIIIFGIPLLVRTSLLSILTERDISDHERFSKEIKVIETILETYNTYFRKKPSIKIKSFSVPNIMVNAFSGTVYLTQGLLENLTFFSWNELRAAIGHEVGHKKRLIKDTSFTIIVPAISVLLTFVFLMIIYIQLITYNLLPSVFSNFSFRMIVIFPTFFCFYPVYFCIQRYKEYKADEESVKFGNKSEHLISFLNKLRKLYEPCEHKETKNRLLLLINSMFETHPNMDKRIKRLERLRENS